LSQPPTIKKIIIDFLPKYFDKAVKRLSFGTSELIESSLVEPLSAQPLPAQPLSVEPPSVKVSTPSLKVPALFKPPATITMNQPELEGSPDINLEFQEVI
jgi:hypothetical protein